MIKITNFFLKNIFFSHVKNHLQYIYKWYKMHELNAWHTFKSVQWIYFNGRNIRRRKKYNPVVKGTLNYQICLSLHWTICNLKCSIFKQVINKWPKRKDQPLCCCLFVKSCYKMTKTNWKYKKETLYYQKKYITIIVIFPP